MSFERTKPAINTLPDKVLVRIFALAKLACIHEVCPHGHEHGDHSRSGNVNIQFYNFTGVCSHWRKIAINTPSLWNHIDIGPNTPSSWTELLLKRTKYNPVHVHVYAAGEEHAAGPEYPHRMLKSAYEATNVVMTLTPHIHRVRSLDYDLYVDPGKLVTDLLDLWLNHGTPNPCNDLLIHYWSGPSRDSHKWYYGPRIFRGRRNNFVNMTRSLSRLRLNGMMLPWNSGAYADLINLQLDFAGIPLAVPVHQIASVLFASQGLITLKMKDVQIVPAPGWSLQAPILLSHLFNLELLDMNENSMELLLPLITLPHTPDERLVTLRVHERTQDTLAAFFARSRMNFLYCHTQFSFVPKRSFLQSFPRVDFLVLSNIPIMYEKPFPGARSASSQPPSIYSIPNVKLWDCPVGFLVLKEFVGEHQVRNLQVEYGTGECSQARFMRLQVVRSRLMQDFPGLEFTLSRDHAPSLAPLSSVEVPRN
ncbi:hypothetical protein FRC07_005447 [Ceratobasidium sp. 392]|nr:hypothetical protein FRC07_005447 [Ceratobasidium sp. 392]